MILAMSEPSNTQPTKVQVIEINEAICHGCGVCASICPRQTIQLSYYDDDQITCKIDALLEAEGM